MILYALKYKCFPFFEFKLENSVAEALGSGGSRVGGGRGAPWRPAKAAAKRAEALVWTLSLASWGRSATFRGGGGGAENGRHTQRVAAAEESVV